MQLTYLINYTRPATRAKAKQCSSTIKLKNGRRYGPAEEEEGNGGAVQQKPPPGAENHQTCICLFDAQVTKELAKMLHDN